MNIILLFKSAKKFGITKRVIFALFFMSAISTLFELVSISMFLPIFDLLQAENPSSFNHEESGFVSKMNGLMNLFGIKLNLGSLLIISFLLFLISRYVIFIAAKFNSEITNSV